MAANKFATMLHRNTNKLTLILIYAALEWVLIFLLLLNSLFSYLIIKFADYFGLKKPCPWCSRVDHILEPQNGTNSYRDLLCEVHASEISKLGYCSNHRKLVETPELCEDCSSPRPELHAGDVGLKCCCCCGVSFAIKNYPPYILIKPSWGVLDYTQKEDCGDLGKTPIGCLLDLEDNHGFDENFENQKNSRVDDGWFCDGENGLEFDCSFVADNFRLREEKVLIKDENSVVVMEDQSPDDDCDDLGKTRIGCLVDLEDNHGFEENCENHKNSRVDDGWFCDGEDNFRLRELVGYEEEQKVLIKEENSVVVMEDQSPDETKEVESVEIPEHLEFFVGHDGFRLIPIELADSPTDDNRICESKVGSRSQVEAPIGSVLDFDLGERGAEEEPKFAVLESMEIEENENSLILHAKECEIVREVYEQVATAQATQIQSEDADADDGQTMAAAEENGTDSDDSRVSEEVTQMANNETGAEVSIGTEIPDLDLIDEIETEEVILHADEVQGYEQTKEASIECRTMPVELSDQANNNSSSFCLELKEIGEKKVVDVEEEKVVDVEEEKVRDVEEEEKVLDVKEEKVVDVEEEKVREVEEEEKVRDVEEEEKVRDVEEEAKVRDVEEEEKVCDFEEEAKIPDVEEEEKVRDVGDEKVLDVEEEKVPDTPTSEDSFQLLKKFLFLEKRESCTEESLDGSVASEFEGNGGEGVMTVERLNSALRAERKVLHAIYAELEEERSASAVAANQTMAMINRLQEEKAAMQMEALQYQRMMEEQSEYDQEALQLLNELMTKREREKQELEKELEVYRKKVMEYEMREKIRIVRKSRDGSGGSGTSSASCSNAGDSDGLSIDLSHEAREDDDNLDNHSSSTPIDAVLNLEGSLANFEEERMSILEQLKVLEEKLFALSDEEDHFYEENGWDVNGFVNGHAKEMNGNHNKEKRMAGPKGKRLLPLFDAISNGNDEDGIANGHENEMDSHMVKMDIENKKVVIEEEVDNLYDRLQALEADREFLKHCVGSLKKGDKGIYLLQEILQHLRDLRNVELRVRDLGDNAPLV